MWMRAMLGMGGLGMSGCEERLVMGIDSDAGISAHSRPPAADSSGCMPSSSTMCRGAPESPPTLVSHWEPGPRARVVVGGAVVLVESVERATG